MAYILSGRQQQNFEESVFQLLCVVNEQELRKAAREAKAPGEWRRVRAESGGVADGPRLSVSGSR